MLLGRLHVIIFKGMVGLFEWLETKIRVHLAFLFICYHMGPEQVF